MRTKLHLSLDYSFATTIRPSLPPKLDLEHPQASTKQSLPTLPCLEVLQFPFKPLSMEQMFVSIFLKTLAVLHTEGGMLLPYHARR